jgi:hypothetical protein
MALFLMRPTSETPQINITPPSSTEVENKNKETHLLPLCALTACTALPVTTVRPSNTHLLSKFKITNIVRFWIMIINENEAEVIKVCSMIACTY